MNTTNRTFLIIAFVIIVLLFLVLGGGMLAGGMMGGASWLWIPTVIVLAIGIFLGWAIFRKK
jgi:hypothetical protein